MLKVKTIRLLILHSSRGSEAPSSGYWLRRVFSWLAVTQDISWAAGKLGCWWGLQSLTGLTETGESTSWFTHLAFGRSQLLPGWFSQRERERQRDPGGFLSWLLPYGCGTVDTSLNGWTRVPSLVEGADCHSSYLLGRMQQCNGTWTVLTTGLGTEPSAVTLDSWLCHSLCDLPPMTETPEPQSQTEQVLPVPQTQMRDKVIQI